MIGTSVMKKLASQVTEEHESWTVQAGHLDVYNYLELKSQNVLIIIKNN